MVFLNWLRRNRSHPDPKPVGTAHGHLLSEESDGLVTEGSISDQNAVRQLAEPDRPATKLSEFDLRDASPVATERIEERSSALSDQIAQDVLDERSSALDGQLPLDVNYEQASVFGDQIPSEGGSSKLEQGKSMARKAAQRLLGVTDDASDDELEGVLAKMIGNDVPLRQFLKALETELVAHQSKFLRVTHIELEFNGNSVRNAGADLDPNLPFGVKLGKMAVQWVRGRSQKVKVTIEVPPTLK